MFQSVNFFDEEAEGETDSVNLKFGEKEEVVLKDKNLTLEEGISGMVVVDASGELVS